jgi:stage II sporulation protein D
VTARLGALALLAATAVVTVTSPTPVASTDAVEMIRVAIADGARAVELRGAEDILVTEPAPCFACAPIAWRGRILKAVPGPSGVELEGRRAGAFRLTSERPIRLNGRDYPGTLDLLRAADGTLTVVNELPLEEYLAGVVRAEAGERWPAEALRAQAIVSRTYAAYHRVLNAEKPFHIIASTAHQLYAGAVGSASPAWAAVHETRGQVLRWEGELFAAFYHTNSGGYTEDPRNVFAARNLPALRPVVCPLVGGSPHFQWSLDLRLSDLADGLTRNGLGVGTVRSIEVSERTASLRATVVTVRGSAGVQRLRGNDFRRIVGYDVLKSTLFAVAVDGQLARFSGRGYGHGVGMCQWGAKVMAEQGATARQILGFYYPGATLATLDAR